MVAEGGDKFNVLLIRTGSDKVVSDGNWSSDLFQAELKNIQAPTKIDAFNVDCMRKCC